VNGANETISATELAKLKFIAFCGLGNPNSFWRSLARQNLKPVERYSYGDHHRYTPLEFKRLARRATDIGATALLCTEKDAVNFFPEIDALLGPLQLWWLEIGMNIDGFEDLLALIRKNI
jgi:tetraacyldisaccharide 4'-kinase